MKNNDTPGDVALNVKRYLTGHGITMARAAEMLGVTAAAVTNQLSSRRTFGRNNARKYAETFGFNENYLITGAGSLFPREEKEAPKEERKEDGGVYIPKETMRMYTSMAETIGRLTEMVDRLTSSAPVKKEIFLPEQNRKR